MGFMRTFRERRIILDIRWGLSGDTLVFIKLRCFLCSVEADYITTTKLRLLST
jgi:hypothetical protein